MMLLKYTLKILYYYRGVPFLDGCVSTWPVRYRTRNGDPTDQQLPPSATAKPPHCVTQLLNGTYRILSW